MEPPKSSKVYYVIGGLIVLAGLFFFLNSSPKNEMKGDETPVRPPAYSVTYSDTGFSPASLEVPTGSKVRFINSSNTNMWVASAMHPTHKELPGFDELKGDPKGTTYEYTFTKAGEWKYHDHLKPGLRGSVIVK
jgi:plastocyanin